MLLFFDLYEPSYLNGEIKNNKKIDKIFETVSYIANSKKQNKYLASAHNNSSSLHINRLINNLPKNSSDYTILDLGSGSGKVCWTLSSKGYNTIGIEEDKFLIRASKTIKNKLECRLNKSIQTPRFIRGNYFNSNLLHKIKEENEINFIYCYCYNKSHKDKVETLVRREFPLSVLFTEI